MHKILCLYVLFPCLVIVTVKEMCNVKTEPYRGLYQCCPFVQGRNQYSQTKEGGNRDQSHLTVKSQSSKAVQGCHLATMNMSEALSLLVKRKGLFDLKARTMKRRVSTIQEMMYQLFRQFINSKINLTVLRSLDKI